MRDYLLQKLGRDNGLRALAEFKTTIDEYLKAWQDEDLVKNIPRIFQARIESASIRHKPFGANWANPDIVSFMFYAGHTNLFIMHLKLLLNRWNVL